MKFVGSKFGIFVWIFKSFSPGFSEEEPSITWSKFFSSKHIFMLDKRLSFAI